MAKLKKMTDDEIDSYIKSKQVSSDQYVAPTVQTGGNTQKRTQSSKSTVTKPTVNNIALFNDANQNIQTQQINKLNNKNGGFFKSGASNPLEGYANTMWDFGADVGKGASQTIEGLSDFLQYKVSDAADFWSKLGKKLLGENNVVSDVTGGYRDFLRDNAKFDSTGSLFGTNENAQDTLLGNEWRNKINEKSYLGDMSDSIGEGLGNIAAMAAMGAVGGSLAGSAGLTTTTASGATKLSTLGKLAVSGSNSYMSAYGNARTEAYKNGANDADAARYGFINGLAEAASEQLFDAMPGIKSAGFADKLGVKDFLANKVKSGLGSNTAKIFLKIAGGFEEGAEEMVSNALVSMGNDLMHMADKSYNYGMENNSGNPLEDGWNALFSEDSLKSFISAGLTSAILGFGGDVLTTTQRNQIISAFAQDNNISFEEAQTIVNGLLADQEKQVREDVARGDVEANNDVEIEDVAKDRIMGGMESGAIKVQQPTQNVQQIEQPVQQTETANIETKPQDNINTQTTPQNVENELKTTNNEVLDNNQQEQVENQERDGLNEKEYNEIKTRYKDLMETIGFEEDINENATPQDIINQLKTIRDVAFGGDGFLESARMEGADVYRQTKSQYDKINRLINRFESKIKQNSEINNERTQQQETPIEEPTPNENIAEPIQEEVKKVNLTGEEGKQHFVNNGVDEKVAEILTEKPKEQKESKKDLLLDVAGETYRLMVSNAGEIERIAKLTKRPSVTQTFDRSMRARAEAQQHIGVAQADLNGKKFKNFIDENGKKTTMSLNGIREDAKKNGIPEKALNEYLAHWLNTDRYNQLNESGQQMLDSLQEQIENGELTQQEAEEIVRNNGGYKYVFAPGYNTEMSRQEIAKLDEKYPELNRIAKNVWTYEHNELKNLYDSGLITENTYKNLANNEHYVRIQREVDEPKTNNRTIIDKNGRLQVNKTVETAKGGTQNILPIMETIADYTQTQLQAERKNIAVRELAHAMGVGSQNDSLGYGEEMFGTNPEFVKSNDDGTYTMTYFENGVATEIPINKAIYDAFVKNKTVSLIENNKVFKFATYAPKRLSKIFRNLTTNYNPLFMVTNAAKDIGDAPFNSKYTAEFLKAYPTGVKQAFSKNGVYKQLYSQLGGQDDSYFTEGEFIDKKSKIQNNKALKTVTAPGRALKNFISKGNEVIESAPRLTEFIATIKANGYEVNKDGDLFVKDSKKAKGKTATQVLDEALYNAAEVTTNFKRGGDVAKSINRNGGTFFNASIQGFDKQIRNFKDAFTSGDKKQIIKLLTKAFIFGIAPTMINDAMYDDDDEYKELQDYIKDNYYLFKGSDGTWIRIPKGRAMSILGSAYRRGKDYANGDEKAFSGFIDFAKGQVAPNNPFESNIISPFSAVSNNKSWSGNKIISSSLEKKPTNEQYNEKTDVFSKWLGEQLKDAPIPDNFKSPMGINYLLDQYTGGLGDVFLPMLTPKATGQSDNPLVQPFVSKFTADSSYSNKSVGTFYDTMTELEKKKNSTNADKIDKLKYSYINSQNMKMSELKKEQSKIQSDTTLNNEEKYNKAKEVQKEINELAKKSVKDLDNIQDNTYYAIVGDNLYYLNKNGTYTKDTYADSHKKTADKKGMALYDYYKEKYEKSKK